MEYPQFKKGDKVRSIFGTYHVVQSQNDCEVSFYDGKSAHPTKIFKVK